MLDFCVSLLLIHVLVIANISGIPTLWQWWVLKVSTTAAQLIGTRFIVSQLVAPLKPAESLLNPIERLSHVV